MSKTLQRLTQSITALLVASLTTSTLAQQSSLVPPQNNFGGQLVHEMVPYQPGVIYSTPVDTTPVGTIPIDTAPIDTTPLYLDACPEFCKPAETGSPVLVAPAEANATEAAPAQFRKGLFQKLFFTGTYIPRLENDSLGFHDLEAGVVLGVPFFKVTAPLLITPRFAVHYLDGPAAPDLPPRVYDAEVSFRHLRKFGTGPWAMNAAVTLGYYSDFESSDADAFRVTGQAFAVYESSPATTWVFGVVYLNREDLSLIPAVGAIYEPNPNVKFEAILPRPRISWRLDNERWVYVGGEFGGGIWSIERPATLTQDLLTYNDYRVLVGIERKASIGAVNHRVEFGYIFGRELEFASATPDVDLDDSLFVRAGLSY